MPFVSSATSYSHRCVRQVKGKPWLPKASCSSPKSFGARIRVRRRGLAACGVSLKDFQRERVHCVMLVCLGRGHGYDQARIGTRRDSSRLSFGGDVRAARGSQGQCLLALLWLDSQQHGVASKFLRGTSFADIAKDGCSPIDIGPVVWRKTRRTGQSGKAQCGNLHR